MPPRITRSAAALAAIVAGGLAAFAFRPTAATNTTLAAHDPAEIRTVTIRRTIHVVRHVPGPAGPGTPGPSGRGRGAQRAAVGTRPSGSHKSGATAGGPPVATRASGSHGASVGAGSASASAPTTRASGSHGAGSTNSVPASTPVATRASGSHGNAPASSGHPVTTRTSGGAHSGGGDDGGDSGGDN